MSCSNCYNGCVEIVSDKCVRYTGIDVPVLGIQTGDSLSYVEQALIEFLTSTLNGMGIKPVIDPTIICDLVKDYLPTCGDLTLNDFISALIKAACDLQVQVSAVAASIATLNANYDVDCLSGVTDTSDTHDVLQAVITKLCDLGVDIAALALDVDTNYVKISELDTLIQAYLDSQPSSSKEYNKMVPYTAVEYYGNLSFFDVTGAGLGDWEEIYLCNGNNGTPDKRGRVAVGAIQMVPGGTLSAAVNPANPGNPNYAVGDTGGANSITLNATQIPAHTHLPNVIDTHYHFEYANVVNTLDVIVNSTDFVARSMNLSPSSNLEYTMNSTATAATLGRTSGSQGSIDVSIASTGGGLPHSNIQPVLACYYIMHIP